MRKRIISLVTAVTVIMTMVIATAVVSVDAGTSYEVPVKITEWSDVSDGTGTPKWEVGSTQTFKYDAKGNVKSTSVVVYNEKGKVSGKWKVPVKWKYKGKKPVKVTAGGKKFKMAGVGTYNKGKLKKGVFKYYKKGKAKTFATETYSYKKGWISKVSGKKGNTKYTVTYSNTFYGNGMPKKMKVSEKAYGETFRKTIKFNKKGLVTSSKGKEFSETVKYTYDSEGRVTEALIADDGFVLYRATYTYNGTKTSKKKVYAGIMNQYFIDHAVKDAVPVPNPYLAK